MQWPIIKTLNLSVLGVLFRFCFLLPIPGLIYDQIYYLWYVYNLELSFRPFFKEFTGMTTGVEYKCGKCASGEGTTCKTSDGDSSNKPAEAGEDFKCKDYEWKEKWVVKSTSTTCKRLKTNTKTQCNM